MNKDDIDDAQLDAFLRGKDELSRRLQALAQPAPSAELDDAILRRAQADLEGEARPAAANDPAPATYPKKLGWRWRLPAALAATVLVGVFAKHSFDASTASRQAELLPKLEEGIVVMEQAEAPAAAAPPPAEAPPLPQLKKALPDKAAAVPPPPVLAERAIEARETKANDAEAYLPAPAPVQAPPVAAAPAPAMGAAAGALQAARDHAVQKQASRAEATVAARMRTAQEVPAAKPWLERIEALLAEGKSAEARAEWDKFHMVYPDHPVPDTTLERLRNIPQQ